MKNLTLFPLQNYKTKIAGVILTTVSILLLIFEKTTRLVFTATFSIQQVIQALILLITLGLFFVAFSKEKIDDDRVRAVRDKALQGAFVVLLALIICLNFISIIRPAFRFGGVHDLSIIALFGLVVYLLIFNMGLFFDTNRIYNNDTVVANMKKNKIFFIVYFSGLILIAFFIAL